MREGGRGSAWLACAVMGVLLWLVVGCGSSSPAGTTVPPLPTPSPGPGSKPFDLLILHTCHTGGVVESTAAGGA